MDRCAAFAHPRDVVHDPDLTVNEKRAILASRASDACAVEAAPTLRCAPVLAARSQSTGSLKRYARSTCTNARSARCGAAEPSRCSGCAERVPSRVPETGCRVEDPNAARSPGFAHVKLLPRRRCGAATLLRSHRHAVKLQRSFRRAICSATGP